MLSHVKVEKGIITIVDTEIENHKFHRYKSANFLENVDIYNVLLSNTIFSDEKEIINALLVTCMMIIKLSHYTKCFRK